VVNSIFNRLYVPGWQGDVAFAAALRIDPVRREAMRIVRHGRLWIPQLQDCSGLRQRNSQKLAELANLNANMGVLGIGPDVTRFGWVALSNQYLLES
jgi:hypothetical protein